MNTCKFTLFSYGTLYIHVHCTLKLDKKNDATIVISVVIVLKQNSVNTIGI